MPRVKAFDKNEALDKAMELFWRKGYSATSYSDLVEHLGINRQSIYDTFGDKQALYSLALDRFSQSSKQELEEQMRKHVSPKAKLRAFLKYQVANNVRDAGKGCFMINSSVELGNADTSIAAKACDNMQEVVSFLEGIIKEGQDKNEISQEHAPHAIALFIYTVLSGLKVNAKLLLPKQAYDDVLEVVFAALDR